MLRSIKFIAGERKKADMSTGNNDRVSSVTVRTTPSNTNSTNNSHECMGRQLGISVSSSGQQQQQQRSNNNSSSIVVSPSPGSSSASILLGPTSSSMYLHHRHCHHSTAPRSSSLVVRRKRSCSASNSTDSASITFDDDSSRRQQQQQQQQPELMMSSSSPQRNGSISLVVDSVARAKCRSALKINDSMVYLDGPQIYTCAQCRTHLTSHDEIISKSFHGRHGRAYLFDHCVNVRIGPAEDRLLITGLHSVSDIFCKRCKALVGWTYSRAYENSQKYKEGKFIVEKINLHLEESDYYDVAPPAGERKDRFRARSISWGSDGHHHRGVAGSGIEEHSSTDDKTVYEYRPTSPIASSLSPRSPNSL